MKFFKSKKIEKKLSYFFKEVLELQYENPDFAPKVGDG